MQVSWGERRQGLSGVRSLSMNRARGFAASEQPDLTAVDWMCGNSGYQCRREESYHLLYSMYVCLPLLTYLGILKQPGEDVKLPCRGIVPSGRPRCQPPSTPRITHASRRISTAKKKKRSRTGCTQLNVAIQAHIDTRMCKTTTPTRVFPAHQANCKGRYIHAWGGLPGLSRALIGPMAGQLI